MTTAPESKRLAFELPSVDMANASTELPADDLLPVPTPDSLAMAEMQVTIERLTHQIATLIGPAGENWQRFKNAAIDSNTTRETLRRRVKSGLVKSRIDEHGIVWVDVVDATRVRCRQAALGG
jgi:hypothetical protein